MERNILCFWSINHLFSTRLTCPSDRSSFFNAPDHSLVPPAGCFDWPPTLPSAEAAHGCDIVLIDGRLLQHLGCGCFRIVPKCTQANVPK